MSASSAAAARWRSHAFGVALDGSFGLMGCPETHAVAQLPRVAMDLAERADLRRSVPPDSPIVAWTYEAAGRLRPAVIGHPRTGYLIDEGRLGVFHVSRSGAHVRCAAGATATWRWQRHLVGQVLPFASALRGRETFHASAVAFGEQALVIVGGSGAGKSTLAAELMLRGARFVADDVVALEVREGNVIVHPGPGLMSLRRAASDRLGQSQIAMLGVRVGADVRAIRLAVGRVEQPLSLTAVLLLERDRGTRRARLVKDSQPDPRRLLGSTYNPLTGPERLIRQLDVCAALARSVDVVRVSLGRSADPAAIAERIRDAVDSGSPVAAPTRGAVD